MALCLSVTLIKKIHYFSSSLLLNNQHLLFPSTSSQLHANLSHHNYYSSFHHHQNLSYSDEKLLYFFGNIQFYAFLITLSSYITHLHQVHAQILVSGLQGNGFLAAKLLNLSSDLGCVSYARKVFDQFTDPDVFLWNAIVRGYSRHNRFGNAIEMYSKMQAKGISPDRFTFPHVLKACSGLHELEYGRRVHGQIIRYGYDCDVFMQNSVVGFYAKCGKIGRARTVFDRLSEKSVVSWTSIISGYVQNGQPLEALGIFRHMRQSNVKMDWIVLVSTLRAYTDVEDFEQGKCIHGWLIKLGLEIELDLLISLIAMYAKSGHVRTARWFFNQMKGSNLILWNAMISGYAKNGYGEEAIELFRKMIAKDIRADSITLRSVVSACAQLGSLGLAKWIDDHISNTSQYKTDIFVRTALIDLYSKCGDIDHARWLFDWTSKKDVFVWSTMITGYGLHGRGREAIEIYDSMMKSGAFPNDVTFLALLAACNHSGLVEQGWEFFNQMKDLGIEPQNQHYMCIVNLLGRAGYLEKARDFVLNMPIEPSPSVWGVLLKACCVHRSVTMGEYCTEKLLSLDPCNNTGYYKKLMSIYASACMWDRVEKIKDLISKKELRKDLGYSVIEINGKHERFHGGDKLQLRSVLHDFLSYEERDETVEMKNIAIAY